MIPKVIHYCWFGKKKKPKLTEKCIKNWRTFCPEYEIIEWNEENCDFAAAPLFVRQAIEQKKWAFAADYFRMKIVYEHGGIYLDTDVELLRSLDAVLDNKVFFGFQQPDQIASGLGFGAEKHAEILREIMAEYQSVPFLRDDGTMDTTPCPVRETAVMRRHGMQPDGSEQLLPGGIRLYPVPVFCPIDMTHTRSCCSEETISIHWFAASWWKNAPIRNCIGAKRYHRMMGVLKRAGCRILGNERFERLKKRLKRRQTEFSKHGYGKAISDDDHIGA